MDKNTFKPYPIIQSFNSYFTLILLSYALIVGCTASKRLEDDRENASNVQPGVFESTNYGDRRTTNTQEYGMHVHYQILIESEATSAVGQNSNTSNPESSSNVTRNQSPSQSGIRHEIDTSEISFSPSPVAQKIIENYLNSEIKMPGGHCLTVSKTRFEKAYREVHGRSPYKDLPDSMATASFTPEQVFNMLYASASQPNKRWRSLPERYRGKGNVGAIVHAGMGTLVDSLGIWNGRLRPGALMQVWRLQEDYELVVEGVDVKKLDPYGHSFIFVDYVRDSVNTIVGITIADQGYQSYRPLIPSDYQVWWGVNLSI